MTTLGATVGGQLAYLGPPMAIGLIWALIRLTRLRSNPELWVLWCASLLPLLFTWGLCLLSPAAEPHWPAQGYLALAVAAAGLLPDDPFRSWRRAARWCVLSAIGLLVIVFVALHLLVFTTAWPALAGSSLYEPRHDLTNELTGWPDVAREALAVREQNEPLVGSHWVICGQLAFAVARVGGRAGVPIRCISPQVDDFDLWGEGAVPRGTAVYVEDERFGTPVSEVFPGWEFEQIGSHNVQRGRWVVRRFRFFRVFRVFRAFRAFRVTPP